MYPRCSQQHFKRSVSWKAEQLCVPLDWIVGFFSYGYRCSVQVFGGTEY